MWTCLTIHPKDWRYRLTSQRVSDCIGFLLSQGIVRPPGTAPHAGPQWEAGPDIVEKFGLNGPPLYVRIEASDRLQVLRGQTEVACPQCEAELACWGEWLGEFYHTEVEPLYRCPVCGRETPFTQLSFRPGAVFSYFTITLTGRGDQVGTRTPFWRELEKQTGTMLSVGVYQVW